MHDPNSGASNLDDEDLVRLIDSLVDEEHRLEREHVGEGLNDSEKGRLRQLEIQLDQAWDLLRRRRARRQAGQDPNEEGPRDPGTVENYQQ